MVEAVDEAMGEAHKVEERPNVPPWEVKDDDAQEHVEEYVCIASQIHLECHKIGLGTSATDLRVSPDDDFTDLVWHQNCDKWLQYKAEEEGRRPSIPVSVLTQRPLHGVRFELFCKGVNVCKACSVICVSWHPHLLF
jgi:hypothetical protein